MWLADILFVMVAAGAASLSVTATGDDPGWGDCVPMATVPGLSGQYLEDVAIQQCQLADSTTGVLWQSVLTSTLLNNLSPWAEIRNLSPIGTEDREDLYLPSNAHHNSHHRWKREIALKKADETLAEQDKLEHELRKKGLVPEPGSSAYMLSLNGQTGGAANVRGRLAARATLALCDCRNYTESAARAAGAGAPLRSKRQPVCERPEHRRSKRLDLSLFITLPDCQPEPRPKCVRNNPYRSISGVCNNMKHRLWGRAGNGQRRLLDNTYDDDLFSPRTLTGTGWPLPSARTITAAIIRANDAECTKQSTLNVVFSQFLSHDISHTPVYAMADLPAHERKMFGNSRAILCCPIRGHVFPVPPLHPQCNPIEVEEGDFFYDKFKQRCMQMVRSLAAPDPECLPRPMQQMNALSAYIDASTIYSSDDTLARLLRANHGGLMRDNHGLLPSRGVRNVHKRSFDDEIDWTGPWKAVGQPPGESHHSGPQLPVNQSCGMGCVGCTCYQAGEARANEQPQLTMMHTIWLREHNRIARALRKFHPDWSDARLYHEARKLVIAEFQHITYNEFLPVLLGYEYCNEHALLPLSGEQFSEFYHEEIRADVANEFSTAAFRMAHSQVQDVIRLVSQLGERTAVNLTSGFFDPQMVASGPDTLSELARGMLDQAAERVDAEFDKSIFGFLFMNHDRERPFGLDLAALNVHRGRDHGIGTYTQMAARCLQRPVDSWRSLRRLMSAEAVQKLQAVYAEPADVDLYIGGVLETHADTAMVGPTFRCIIGDTFFRLRHGDRFFYDNGGMVHSFTAERLVQVRRTSMSRVLCDNLDAFPTVPPLALLKSGIEFNRLELCRSQAVPKVDISVF